MNRRTDTPRRVSDRRRAAERRSTASPVSDIEIANDMIVAQAALIEELQANVWKLEKARAPADISAPTAIAYLKELMRGTAATLLISDSCDSLVEVRFGAGQETLSVFPQDVVNLVDALTTVEDFRVGVPF